LRRIEDLSSEL